MVGINGQLLTFSGLTLVIQLKSSLRNRNSSSHEIIIK